MLGLSGSPICYQPSQKAEVYAAIFCLEKMEEICSTQAVLDGVDLFVLPCLYPIIDTCEHSVLSWVSSVV